MTSQDTKVLVYGNGCRKLGRKGQDLYSGLEHRNWAPCVQCPVEMVLTTLLHRLLSPYFLGPQIPAVMTCGSQGCHSSALQPRRWRRPPWALAQMGRPAAGIVRAPSSTLCVLAPCFLRVRMMSVRTMTASARPRCPQEEGKPIVLSDTRREDSWVREVKTRMEGPAQMPERRGGTVTMQE